MQSLVTAVVALAAARNLDDVTRRLRRAAREFTQAEGVAFMLREGTRCRAMLQSTQLTSEHSSTFQGSAGQGGTGVAGLPCLEWPVHPEIFVGHIATLAEIR